MHISAVSCKDDKLQGYALTGISDVLRRRFQVNTMPGMGYKYTSIWGAIRQIAVQEGIKGFYKGLTPNLLKVAPSMAVNWWSFEFAKDFFMRQNPDED